jgi:xanthine dehydrogenase molybdopterin-binding subunit B
MTIDSFRLAALLLGDNGLSGVSLIVADLDNMLPTVMYRVPKFEGGEMEVFSSTQALTDCQRWVAQVGLYRQRGLITVLTYLPKVTNVPRNRIVARGKRMGGAFGGKETRSSQVYSSRAATVFLLTMNE